MQRAHGSDDAAATAAAAATVAPLLQLKRAANKAEKLARFARAVELYTRAVAAAELALLCNSLVVAALLHELSATHILGSDAHPGSSTDAESAEFSQRSLVLLLHERWQAGTLFSPTAEEVAYLAEDEYPGLPAQMCGAYFYIHVAGLTAQLLQKNNLAPSTTAEAEARVHAVYGALRTALEADARGMLERHPRTGQAWPASSGSAAMVSHLKSAVHRLVTSALSDEAGLLLRMRAACGLPAAEETALNQLAERYKVEGKRSMQELAKRIERLNAKQQQAAAADAARHGLRRCALPACDAQEPHPKLFKLCGRCHATAYCCKQHQTEDWKRHKREDGCEAAA
jgi:hypothetical protein